MRRVYDQPAEATTTVDELWGERPDLITAWDRMYKVLAVEAYWETMRPWWTRDQLPDPLDYRVRHWKVEAASSKGRGVLELEGRHEGWRVIAVWD